MMATTEQMRMIKYDDRGTYLQRYSTVHFISCHICLRSCHIWFNGHNLHGEQEQAGPVQFKIFLLKSSNDTDAFNCLSSSSTLRWLVPFFVKLHPSSW